MCQDWKSKLTLGALVGLCAGACCPATMRLGSATAGNFTPATLVVPTGSGSSEGGRAEFNRSGRIVSVDGHSVDACPETVLELSPGCHVIVADYEVKVSKSVHSYDDRAVGTCEKGGPGGFHYCNKSATHGSGLHRFAVEMVAGRQYELTAAFFDDRVTPRIVEVDATEGTLARFDPVGPDVDACTSRAVAVTAEAAPVPAQPPATPPPSADSTATNPSPAAAEQQERAAPPAPTGAPSSDPDATAPSVGTATTLPTGQTPQPAPAPVAQ
jgi:hypothetical protein